MTKPEYVDTTLYEGMSNLAKDLGIKHERLTKVQDLAASVTASRAAIASSRNMLPVNECLRTRSVISSIINTALSIDSSITRIKPAQH
jgi:hypothetical protein